MRATKKLLDRVGPPSVGKGEQSTTLLGQWYATAVFWKPQVALFVNEGSLLPVLMPLAPDPSHLARSDPVERRRIATSSPDRGSTGPGITPRLRQMSYGGWLDSSTA